MGVGISSDEAEGEAEWCLWQLKLWGILKHRNGFRAAYVQDAGTGPRDLMPCLSLPQPLCGKVYFDGLFFCQSQELNSILELNICEVHVLLLRQENHRHVLVGIELGSFLRHLLSPLPSSVPSLLFLLFQLCTIVSFSDLGEPASSHCYWELEVSGNGAWHSGFKMHLLPDNLLELVGSWLVLK